MEEGLTRWDEALRALEVLYRDIEKRSLSLPAFSLLPFAISLWAVIKFEFFLILDILLIWLIIPINVVIFIRNIFPGKWNYHSFSARYWKYAITWIWRGEAPITPSVIIRPLVMFWVTVHVNNRIGTINRYIYLDDSLSKDDRIRIGAKVADILEHWKRPTGLQVVYNYILPATGPLIGLYKILFPAELPQWTSLLVIGLISYSIGFVITAFMVKRALMLGASDHALYFPGAIIGNQSYIKEKDFLDSIGIKKKEFPFDILLLFVSVMIGYLSLPLWEPLYKLSGVTMPAPTSKPIIIQMSLFLVISILALYRRRSTGRL